MKCEHVFIVFTPLHVLIADAIIRREGIRGARVLAFVDGSAKIRKCCERYLAREANVAYVPLYRDARMLSAAAAVKRFASVLGAVPTRVYTGSLKSLYTRIFLGLLPGAFDLNTFDDGYGSLVMDGYFSKPDAPLKRLAIKLANWRLDYQRLMSMIDKHYTIYQCEHVYSQYCRETVRVTIDPRADDGEELPISPRHGAPVKILLTQPVSERLGISMADEVAAYNAAIERFRIEYRLPHPAEGMAKDSSLAVTTVVSDLIAEELVCSLAKHGPVELYAFGSTVLLNVAELSNVSSYWLMDPGINARLPVHAATARLHVIEAARP